jgi:TetR/AcrR family transcriptional regulator
LPKHGFGGAFSQGEVPRELDPAARAAVVPDNAISRWHRFAKSGFRKVPADGLDGQMPLLVG